MGIITVYGIANCDTVKRARAWLAERGAEPAWHDFKRQGVPEAELDRWLRDVGWETLLNRKGTTWRKVTAEEQAAVVDAASARRLMLDQSSVIKRPVVRWADGKTTVGFSGELFLERLGG